LPRGLEEVKRRRFYAAVLLWSLGGLILIHWDLWDLHYAQPQMMQISLEIAAEIRQEILAA